MSSLPPSFDGRDTLLTERPENSTRRGFLARVASTPALALATTPRPAAVDRATADRLAELHREYRTTWTEALKSHREFEAAKDAACDMPVGPERDAEFDRLRDLIPERHGPEYRHRRVWCDFYEAIVTAAGRTEQSPDDWSDNSRPSAMIRVGDLLYIATWCFDLDLYGEEDPGCGDIIVIDLGEIGGDR